MKKIYGAFFFISIRVKDPKIPADTVTNLRPIAVSDVYSTIYEKIVLIEIKKTRVENKKQFGFKSNGSCAHAVFLVVQALKISRQLKKTIYMLAIDLTRAFDTIYIQLLWLKMFIAKVNPIIIMSLIEYYGALFAYIELDGELSKVIKLITGVKQGGPSTQRCSISMVMV